MTPQVVQQVTRQLRARAIISSGVAGGMSLKQPIELRQAGREVKVQMCSYQLVDRVGSEGFVIESGEAVTINRSNGGMLLLMSRAPLAGQYLEIHTEPTHGRRAAYVFEARWSKPVTVESEGDLYLVGCRRTFGPCRYFEF